MSIVARSLAPASVTVLVACLSACASTPGDLARDACPQAQIAVPSDRIGHNNSEGELRFVAVMEELTSDCRRAEGEDDVEVDITFAMRAERGPAFEGQPVQLTYFLATVDPQREIIDKQVLDVQLDFGPDQPKSALRESVTLRLPASTEASGANYSLYLGFQPDGRAKQAKATTPKKTVVSAPAKPEATGASKESDTDEVEIVFALNSSTLPNGAGDLLRAFIQTLDENRRYVLHVETSIDSDPSVVGAKSVEEAQRYDLWLAERRFRRVEAWLRDNADGRTFTLESTVVEDDQSRKIRIQSNPIG